MIGGQDVNARSPNGGTAAMFAGGSGHSDCLRQLAVLGADLTLVDSDEWSVIHKLS